MHQLIHENDGLGDIWENHMPLHMNDQRFLESFETHEAKYVSILDMGVITAINLCQRSIFKQTSDW